VTGSKTYDYSYNKQVSIADMTVTKMNDSNAYWVVDFYPNTNASSFKLNAESTLW